MNTQPSNTEKSGERQASPEFAKVIPYNLRVLRGDIPVMMPSLTVEDVELTEGKGRPIYYNILDPVVHKCYFMIRL